MKFSWQHCATAKYRHWLQQTDITLRRTDVTLLSPLHTIRHCSRTVTKQLFREKNYVSRKVTKRGLHTIRHRPRFSRT